MREWLTSCLHPPHQEYELEVEEYMKEMLRKREEEVLSMPHTCHLYYCCVGETYPGRTEKGNV